MVGKLQRIEKFDHLAFSVYTRNGEMLIDPEGELNLGRQQTGQNIQTIQHGQQLFKIQGNNQPPAFYVVDDQGEVNLPAIGKIRLEGLTLIQADSLLSREYEAKGFYKNTFIVTQYLNKRVILLGALGDRVVRLPYENMTVLEVLAQPDANVFAGGANALFSGMNIQSRARAIVIIRNLQNNPQELQFEEIDLRNLDGLYHKNLHVQHGDVIYVRPRRRFDREITGDISFLTSAISSLLTLYLLFENLRRRP